ncbi:hypothetical protein D3M70_26430 [Pseudomonas sp. LS-2]|nr:hypothetical protein D3M70_26430 [Pseudomonas sp. LS-2]
MALDDYKRRPGLQDLTRLYPTCVGTATYRSLESALLGGRYASSVAVGHLELRVELRWFLQRHLQQSLIQAQHATAPIIDNYLSTDLGL